MEEEDMKVKLELDLTPDEFQDLFVPSEKQREFAQMLSRAYAQAVKEVAAEFLDQLKPRKKPRD